MKKICQECGSEYDTRIRVPSRNRGADTQSMYCSESCARRAQNRRAYEKEKKKGEK